jgi:hypothetical protein
MLRRGEIRIGLFLLGIFVISSTTSGVIDETGVIRQRMVSLGFLDCTVATETDGSYVIKVNAYAQRSQALSLDGVFRPFEVRAVYSQGILYLEKSDIETAGFSVQEEYLPRGVKIVQRGITARSLHRQTIGNDPNIERIERALEKTKRNRTKVFANCRKIVVKLNETFAVAFPDVCKTPSPGGPIPIPYPNIAKSSDLAKSTKKVKADQAEAIANHSDFKKSESNEVGTRSRGLQNVYHRTIAKRELSTEEKAKVKEELQSCLDKARLLMKTLDKYVEEIEKLLQQAK